MYHLDFIKGYSVCFVIAMFCGAIVVWHICRKAGVSQQQYNRLVPVALLSILLGARLGHCFFYEWQYYSQHWLEILLPCRQLSNGWKFTGYQGLASHGAIVGLMLGLWLFSKREHIQLSVLYDSFAIATPLAGIFIRLGNFINGEIVGTPTQLPWGIVFCNIDDLPRHPAQLYEAIMFLLMFVVLVVLWKHHGARFNYFYFTVSVLMVSLSRFLVEFVKMEQGILTFPPFTVGQWLSLPFVVVGIVSFFILLRRK
jgi:prolipoprotein diacylglyceryl transferase